MAESIASRPQAQVDLTDAGLYRNGFPHEVFLGQLEDQVRCWAVSIVENALERGRCGFVRDAAYLLPMHMIADIVGIPVEDRGSLFGGAGPRLSLGAHLAGCEIAILFEELLQRVREIEVLCPPTCSTVSISNPVLLAVAELPVQLA
ncbi:MAG: hypothetical protein ACLQPH_21080 [Acidimicrobiales bacterium]